MVKSTAHHFPTTLVSNVRFGARSSRVAVPVRCGTVFTFHCLFPSIRLNSAAADPNGISRLYLCTSGLLYEQRPFFLTRKAALTSFSAVAMLAWISFSYRLIPEAYFEQNKFRSDRRVFLIVNDGIEWTILCDCFGYFAIDAVKCFPRRPSTPRKDECPRTHG